MEFRQLDTFQRITRVHSFSKAAQELGYAQSTVTMQIGLLEEELGVKLFDRLGHHISLTAEGKKLLPFADQILKLRVDAKETMKTCNQPSGALVIGALESLCIYGLSRVIKEYKCRYPAVNIIIKFGSEKEFMKRMRENTIDFAFVMNRIISDPDFVPMISRYEPMEFVTSTEDTLASKKNITPPELNDKSLVLTEVGCGYRKFVDEIMSEYKIIPKSVIESGNVQVIKQLVMSGLGIGFLPRISVVEELEQNKLVSLRWDGPKPQIYTQGLYHKSKHCSAAMTAFIDILKEFEMSWHLI